MVRIMDEIISYKMCAVKVRNAKLRNYLKMGILECKFYHLLDLTRSSCEKYNYRVYKKKLNRFEIALSFGKQLLVSSF